MLINRKYWLLGILLAAAIALGAMDLGRDAGAQSTQYEDLKIFTEVLTSVQRNYVEEVDSKDLVYDALRGMLKELDPHSAFLTPDAFKEMKVDTKGEFGGLGIQISIRDGILTIISPIEDTPAWRIGLKAGDKIVKIEDEPTKDMSLFDAVARMRGKKGTKITIYIMREGLTEPKAFTITRDIIKIKSVKSRMIDGNIGYVKLRQFQETSADEVEDALRERIQEGATSIILDLRNNPGGLLISSIDIAGAFLPRDTLVVYTKGRSGAKIEYRSKMAPVTDSMPMVVLVNQGSASASEIVAGALQDWKRAVVLGTTSFGKASVQSVIPLSDGSGIRITTAKYYTPKGSLIQNTGIEPDIVVELTASNGAKEHVVIREKDLEGRLDNEQTKSDDKKTEEKKPKTVVMLGDVKEDDDNQLQRAIDLLKTWVVFKDLPTG